MPERLLKNGLFIIEFSPVTQDFDRTVSFLQQDPSCLVLDTIITPNNLLAVFDYQDGTSEGALVLYDHVANRITPHRIPVPQNGDTFDGRLKTENRYASLGGSIQWAKVRFLRSEVDNIRSHLTGDPRVGYTFATETGWIYSRVKIPEPKASEDLQRLYADLTNGNNFSYIPVIRELKPPNVSQ